MISLSKKICNNLSQGKSREWLITNGIGGYASGTISGILTRRYHGLLIASFNPPLNRHLLLTKLIETIKYKEKNYQLDSNIWRDKTIFPQGYLFCEEFYLEGTSVIWKYACGDGLIKKQIWMNQGENTTYIKYTIERANSPVKINLQALGNYRNHHYLTSQPNLNCLITKTTHGLKIQPNGQFIPFYLLCQEDKWQIPEQNQWYFNFNLDLEKYRGQDYIEHHLLVGNYEISLNVNQSITIVATTELTTELNGEISWQKYHNYEQELLKLTCLKNKSNFPKHLILASDQFIVKRDSLNTEDQTPLTSQNHHQGKTIIAGYPWFGDWGRDTMISLAGLTLVAGKFSTARKILLTFAKYLDQGMLPNCFPEKGFSPYYNTVDAPLWYFEAMENYLYFTQDFSLLAELFESLQSIINYYIKGTRFNIHLTEDGLIFAGEKGSQLTWMDAKVGDLVITPRIGKPVEINALWYNALILMTKWAIKLNKEYQSYQELAEKTRINFQKFWHKDLKYCYDVIDNQGINDSSLRPNQIFAISLPTFTPCAQPLLNLEQQKHIIKTIEKELLTPYGLKTLNRENPHYCGVYGGNQFIRDQAYHQGTVWPWLIGHFIQAHLKVYQNQDLALGFLNPFKTHLQEAGINQISEIFDGDFPHNARGCFAQAWSVAEVLRGFWLVENFDSFSIK
jgi:predicted glycogen debranching enzyme